MSNQLLRKKIKRLWNIINAVYLIIANKVYTGQYTIYAMFMTILTLVAYIAVHPVLQTIIDEAGITGIEGNLISWTPLFIILFILWSAMWYVNPQERR